MSGRKTKKPVSPPPPPYPMVFETYRELAGYWQTQLEQEHPSVFNGWVRVRRYRVTVEEVPEPLEVLRSRLQTLWDECDNHHHWTPLKKAAAEIGCELIGSAGSKRKS